MPLDIHVIRLNIFMTIHSSYAFDCMFIFIIDNEITFFVTYPQTY